MAAKPDEDLFEKFVQSLEEDPKSVDENPTEIDFNFQAPINVQDPNQNLITGLPPNNQNPILPPINPTPIENSAFSSNNQYHPMFNFPMDSQGFAIPPLSSIPIPIKNDQNRPASNKRPAHLPETRQTKRPASSPRPTEPPLVSAKGPEIFSFKLKPFGRFRDAIQALYDINLHPGGLALIEVDESGFKVIVQDDSTKAMGVLHLNTELLTEFRCAMRFQKLCSGILDSILIIFSSVRKIQYEDVLTVYYKEASRFLYLKFDGDRKAVAPVDIVEQLGLGDDVLRKWQPGNVSNVFCVAVITTDVLKEKIRSLMHSETVTVEMTSLNVTISIKGEGFSRNFEIPQGTGVPEGQKNCSEFKFLHGNSLQKACSLSQIFAVGIQTSPNRVLLQFGLENLGTLLFIKPCVNSLINL